MGAWSYPMCETCDGFGELEPYSLSDERPCPDCDGSGADTSKPKVWCDGKIAKAVEMARGYDAPPSVPITFKEGSNG